MKLRFYAQVVGAKETLACRVMEPHLVMFWIACELSLYVCCLWFSQLFMVSFLSVYYYFWGSIVLPEGHQVRLHLHACELVQLERRGLAQKSSQR